MAWRSSLVLMILSTSLSLPSVAQEIYRWEDQNGVIHYSDTPNSPTAAPLNTTDIPYSHTGSLPAGPEVEQEARPSPKLREPYFNRQPRRPQGLPSLSHLHAGLAPNGHLQLSGEIRMKGNSLCYGPAVEVTIIDELGNEDGTFVTSARLEVVAGGDKTDFAGEYLTPVGGSFMWEAAPFCSTEDGPVYGAHQRGTLKTTYGRIVRAKKLRRR